MLFADEDNKPLLFEENPKLIQKLLHLIQAIYWVRMSCVVNFVDCTVVQVCNSNKSFAKRHM